MFWTLMNKKLPSHQSKNNNIIKTAMLAALKLACPLWFASVSLKMQMNISLKMKWGNYDVQHVSNKHSICQMLTCQHVFALNIKGFQPGFHGGLCKGVCRQRKHKGIQIVICDKLGTLSLSIIEHNVMLKYNVIGEMLHYTGKPWSMVGQTLSNLEKWN